MYNNFSELYEIANKNNKLFWEVIVENEMLLSGLNKEQIFNKLKERLLVMQGSSEKALNTPLKTVGGLIEGISKTQNDYANKQNSVSGDFINKLMARALSSSEVNASMGKICAAPTAGACGIVPSVLMSLKEKYNLDETTLLESLSTASGVGAIITKNATVSGAEGGCQAECGVAAAMAASAAVFVAKGTNEMILHAVSISLMNCMGLVCDPVAGLVQIPCAQRNASQAVNAVISADMALAGMNSVIPADEVVEAMFKVGKSLPMELRETALGGIANSKTGKSIKKKVFNDSTKK